MRGPGFEPGSSGWKPEILTTELPTLIFSIEFSVLKVLCTRLVGLEPTTSSLGGKHSIQAELQAHILKRVYWFKKYVN